MEIRGVGVSGSSNFPSINEGENNLFVPQTEEKITQTGFFPKEKSKQLTKINGGEKSSKIGTKELSPEEQKKVEELKRIDAKVRAHEMAHLAAGAGLVRGGANYTYEIGPDGKQYAVAGEVKIDMSVNPDDPERAIQKMQQVRRAALAPVDPSPQDRSVAQQASNIESQMRSKLLEEKAKPQNKFSKVYKTYQDFGAKTPTSKPPEENTQSNEFIPTPTVQSLKKKVDFLV